MTSNATVAAAGTGDGAGTTFGELPEFVINFLNTGRFAEYHLAKAKLALGDRDFKNALYQVKASLCHDALDPEAVGQVRREALELKAEIGRQQRASR